MKLLKIDDDIKNGLTKNVYLLFGEEYFLVDKYKNQIIKTLIPNKEDYDMNITTFDGDKTEALKVIETTQMMSFTGHRRVIICIDTGLFYKGRSDESEIMTDFLKNSDDDYLILFIEKNVDKRSKLYKIVQKNGIAEEFNELKPDEMVKFIIENVEKNSCSISLSDARYLAFNAYNKIENVLNEVNKLTAYKLNDVITKDDIDLLVSKNLEVRIFELVENIGKKNAKMCIDIFNNMLLVKESPIMILTMIGRQFKILLLCKTLVDEGHSSDFIAKKTKLHPYVVKKTLTSINNFKKITLYNALIDVVDTDEKIKTGKIKDTIGVETIILKYTL